jgi:hypothetical protein
MSGYVVIHEWPHPAGETWRDPVSSVHPDRDSIENHLAHCEGMQAAGKRGTEGRYYIARIVEDEA